MKMKLIVAAGVAAALNAGTALAHGDGNDAAKPKPHAAMHHDAEQMPFGIAGDAKKAKRTVKIDMRDSMRFEPAELTIKRGETVRFELSNSGKVLHELVLGRMEDLTHHAEMMRKHPGMEHDEMHMVHVKPGKRGSMVWQFNRAGEFHYGCLIPGHFEAGMVGRVRVVE